MSSGSLQVDFANKSYLIIDDFQGMRGMLRDVLRGCGADVKRISEAASGKDAIALLERNRFDIVLCDFNLGAGKNGQQILEEAKVRGLIGPACAWIMVTAEKTTDIVTGTAEYQPDTYIVKPITEATIRTRLGKIWGKKEAFAEIDAALMRRDYSRAISLCDERRMVDKANAYELQRLKCQLLLEAGDIDQARQGYSEVLAVRDTPWAMVGMAKVCFLSGDFDGAKMKLERVIADNPAFLEAHDWLAKTLQALGDIKASEQILERAARLSPNAVLRQRALGEVALKLGKLDNAERAFRKSVSLGEHSVLNTPDAYLGLAKTYSAKDNPAEALRVIGTLNKTFDNDDVRLKSLAVEGQVHHKSGNLELASKTAKELSERMATSGATATPEAAMEVARLLFATGDRESAVSLLQNEVKNSPDNPALLAEVQSIFDTADMPDEGVQLVEASRREATDMMNRGVLLAREGKLEEAIAWMRDARNTMPHNVRVLFNSAHVLVTQMQQRGFDAELLAEARHCLESANRLAPGDRRFGLLMSAIDKLTA